MQAALPQVVPLASAVAAVAEIELAAAEAVAEAVAVLVDEEVDE